MPGNILNLVLRGKLGSARRLFYPLRTLVGMGLSWRALVPALCAFSLPSSSVQVSVCYLEVQVA